MNDDSWPPSAEICFNETEDVLAAGSDLRKMVRSLESSLAAEAMLRPDAHKVLKHYIRIWDALEKELQIVRSTAERRSAIQRLGGG